MPLSKADGALYAAYLSWCLARGEEPMHAVDLISCVTEQQSWSVASAAEDSRVEATATRKAYGSVWAPPIRHWPSGLVRYRAKITCANGKRKDIPVPEEHCATKSAAFDYVSGVQSRILRKKVVRAPF